MSDGNAEPDEQELIAQLRAQLQSPPSADEHGASQHGGDTTGAPADGVNRAGAGIGDGGLDGLGPGVLQAPRTFPTVSPDAYVIADALLGIAHRAEDALESPSAASGVRPTTAGYRQQRPRM